MNDGILLAYARAMRSAQGLEGLLKILFGLHNVIYGTSKNQSRLIDDEFEALIFAGNKKTFGQTLNAIFQKLTELGLRPFPDNAQEALRETVRIRNFLVHHYFEQRILLSKDENT